MHFDHTGCAMHIRERYGCPVYLPEGELENLDDQTLPPDLYRAVTDYIPADCRCLELGPVSLEIVRTRGGHTCDHCGFITPDDVFCVGDILMAGHTLRAARLPYTEDFDADIAGKRAMAAHAGHRAFILSHEGIVTDGGEFAALVEENVALMERMRAMILDSVPRRYTPLKEIIESVRRAAGIPNGGTRLLAVVFTVTHAMETFRRDGLALAAPGPEGGMLYRQI